MDVSSIDLGNNFAEIKPLQERGHISILLGAGFSAPAGYPTGPEMNAGIMDFVKKENFYFSGDGKLCESKDKSASVDVFHNEYQSTYTLCKKLVEAFKQNKGYFDYEDFYDFICSDEFYEEKYWSLCDDLIDKNVETTQEYYFRKLPIIYNQVVRHLLSDKNGKKHYKRNDDMRFVGEAYDGFLRYLSSLSENYIIDIHTLNHDLLFESFDYTESLQEKIADGFCEIHSPYYGVLKYNENSYHCRLEYYTGNYIKPVRLYKLHGSIDYAPFHINGDYDCHVKVKRETLIDNLLKEVGETYCEDFFNYCPEFLSGKKTKTSKYGARFYQDLMNLFKNNLSCAEKLIIIGYGFKDEGINKIIKCCFDKRKPSFIVDKQRKIGSASPIVHFGKEMNSKILLVGIEGINGELLS